MMAEVHRMVGSGGVPVSVLIPHSPVRAPLLESMVVPTLLAAGPAEVLIHSGDGHPCVKRNALAARAGCELLMFYDDDILCDPDALTILANALNRSSEDADDQPAALAYSDFAVVNHPIERTRINRAEHWNPALLRERNYIAIMALIRRDAFLGFDEALHRYQDWDLWLRIAASGRYGVYVPRTLFTCLGAVGRWPVISRRDETQITGRQALAAKHGISAGLGRIGVGQ